MSDASPRLAQLATQKLASSLPPPILRDAATDARAIDAIERAIRRESRMHRARRAVIAAGGIAATIAGGAAIARTFSSRPPPPSVTSSMTLASGAHLALEGADVVVSEAGGGPRVVLRSGAAFADVPELARDEKLVVATPDAQIEARGTSVRVSIVPAATDCGGGIVTRVLVSRGSVVVRTSRGEEKVAAPNPWPPGCY